jgi:hypothetical protein
MAIFVQLFHPSGEPKLSFITNGKCPENTVNNGQPHFRKFIHSKNGSYVIPNSSDDTKTWPRNDGCFTFWGEWEHSSSVTFPPSFRNRSSVYRNNGFPFQLHTPITPPILPPNGGTNKTLFTESTDPFVFCEPMLYFCCQIKGNNQLRKLSCGDIVVFGSKLNGQFVVDTVFVVSDQVSVYDTALCELFAQANDAHFSATSQVYRGATLANPVDGMFSFFPALPCDADGTPQPFQRPTLVLRSFPGFISQELNQHHKISPENKTARPTHNNYDVWSEIVSEITAQSKVLGLRATV